MAVGKNTYANDVDCCGVVNTRLTLLEFYWLYGVTQVRQSRWCCCQFDVDAPPDDTSLMRYVVLVVAAAALLAFTGSFIFVCWWSVCRRQTALHADSKANCPGMRHPSSNKWSKDFDERPHRRGDIDQSGTLQSAAAVALLRTEWSFYCVHHSRDSQCISMSRTMPQIGPSLGISTPCNALFLGPTCVSLPKVSRSVQPFMYNTSVWPTRRYKDMRHL